MTDVAMTIWLSPQGRESKVSVGLALLKTDQKLRELGVKGTITFTKPWKDRYHRCWEFYALGESDLSQEEYNARIAKMFPEY